MGCKALLRMGRLILLHRPGHHGHIGWIGCMGCTGCIGQGIMDRDVLEVGVPLTALTALEFDKQHSALEDDGARPQ